MCRWIILIHLVAMVQEGTALITMNTVRSRPNSVLLQSQSSGLTVNDGRRSVVRCGMKRRVALTNLVATMSGLTSFSNMVLADDDLSNRGTTSDDENILNQRPRSPLESLLPAIKFRRVLDKAIIIVEKASEPTTTIDEQLDALDGLNNLLLSRQNYTSKFSAVPTTPGRQYLEAYQRNREKMPLFEKPGAFLFENGEIDAWRRLKRQERAREEIDEVRAALNAYTNDLSFRTDQYTFYESKELKSKLIREDRLPDVKQVITSDLGLRYLYRNNVLDAMEDARAEIRFLQRGVRADTKIDAQSRLDFAELRRLLMEADHALEKWFSLIDEQDVRNANAAV